MRHMKFSFLNRIVPTVLLIVLTFSYSHAQTVTLKLKNGSFTLTGKLLNFNGKYYVVKAKEFGEITVDAKKFSCISGNCPEKKIKKTARKKLPVTLNFGIHGSNTIGAQLMPALVESYAKKTNLKIQKVIGSSSEEIILNLTNLNGDKLGKIELHSHGSGTSFPGLVSGAAQIGMSSRPIKNKEQKAMASAGIYNMKSVNREHILALDGLIVILSPTNPINSLSMSQIAKIFSGQINDWSQVGRDKPGPINIYARDVKSGTFDTFNALVLKPQKLKISSQAKRFESNPDLSDNVARDPNGIGFTGFAYKRNSKAITISSKCGIYQKPTLFNVKTEEYPLARRLYLYTTQDLRSPHAKKLLKFSLSENAQNTITDAGFVNQSIQLIPFSELGNHLASAINTKNEEFNLELTKKFAREFIDASRLSVTYRFKQGSIKLTNKSKSDIHRFVKLLQTSKLKNKDIFLIGYSSAQGPFELNKELAFKRALSIKAALLSVGGDKIAHDKIQIRSFGELFPVSCNDTKSGQSKNQRVEVWVR